MSAIRLINGSCADQIVDVVVNAANSGLWAGGGICGGSGFWQNTKRVQRTI